MDDKFTKYVKLNRNGNQGFGFSILGGAGSEFPPIVYEVIIGSPAHNSKQVSVVSCLQFILII